MKLGELNGAIRKLKGAPTTTAYIRTPDGQRYALRGLEFTKQSLLNALKDAFEGQNRAVETHLSLVEGKLVMDVPRDADDGDPPVEAFRHPDAGDPAPPATADEPDPVDAMFGLTEDAPQPEADDDLDSMFG